MSLDGPIDIVGTYFRLNWVIWQRMTFSFFSRALS